MGVESPPANAGDVSLTPDLRGPRMPQMNYARVPQLLSLRARAWEPQLLKPPLSRARALQHEKPLQREAYASQPEKSPSSNKDPA